jgi:hypothetical protein
MAIRWGINTARKAFLKTFNKFSQVTGSNPKRR